MLVVVEPGPVPGKEGRADEGRKGDRRREGGKRGKEEKEEKERSRNAKTH